MPFADEILAGEELIRSAIRSDNYAPGVSGWRIARDGTAEFMSATIRGDLQSSNYVPGGPGWKLDNAGTAEMYDLTARGSLATGAPGSRRILIEDIAGESHMRFYSGNAAETAPGEIKQFSVSELNIASPQTTALPTEVEVLLWSNSAGAGGGVTMSTGIFPASTTGYLELVNMYLTSTEMTPTTGQDNTGATTSATAFGAAGGNATVTCPYPLSGRMLILFHALAWTNSATNGAIMNFEIHDTNAGGTLRRGANEQGSIRGGGTVTQGGGSYAYVDGMPTSGTMFVRGMYRCTSAAAIATFDNIGITVVPLP